ncbi:hypothetical protein EMIT0111MI5_60005 [Burkholderia sp. IT-111MI5]
MSRHRPRERRDAVADAVARLPAGLLARRRLVRRRSPLRGARARGDGRAAAVRGRALDRLDRRRCRAAVPHVEDGARSACAGQGGRRRRGRGTAAARKRAAQFPARDAARDVVAERDPVVRGGRRRTDRESRRDHAGHRVGVPVGLLPRRPRVDALHVHAREPGPQARGRRADARVPRRVGAAVRLFLVQRDRRRLPRPDRARGVSEAGLHGPRVEPRHQ